MFLPDSDPDPQPEEVLYTPNLEMLHSSLVKEIDCSSGSQPGVRDSLSLEEIGHIRWVSDAVDNGNGMMGQFLQTGARKGICRVPP